MSEYERNQVFEGLILAGGRGLRLRPITLTLPKPMMPLGDIGIGELVLLRFADAGFDKVTIATHYLGGYVKNYYCSLDATVELEFLQETRPLGTAGALSHFRNRGSAVMTCNADILTDADFRAITDAHNASGCAITIVASYVEEFSPYGILKLDNNMRLINWEEKRSDRFLVSTGINVLDPEAIRIGTDGAPADMPECIARCREAGMPVNVYVHKGVWIDVGQPHRYRQAVELFGADPNRFLGERPRAASECATPFLEEDAYAD